MVFSAKAAIAMGFLQPSTERTAPSSGWIDLADERRPSAGRRRAAHAVAERALEPLQTFQIDEAIVEEAA
jgi:hypothetical protein